MEMIILDELDRRAWAGAIVDDCPQDVDEPVRAMTTPRVPFRWSKYAHGLLERLKKGANP